MALIKVLYFACILFSKSKFQDEFSDSPAEEWHVLDGKLEMGS
jgi:hypothetical protein